MIHVRAIASCLACICLAALFGAAPARSADGQQDGPAGEVGLEALTRGPLHEGFAQPIGFDPRPGPFVDQQPPDPIEELPPEYRPRGRSVGWMPGYWSWDTEPAKFIWTSGFWRVWPPEREYVPGYWERTDAGWRWVSGFWLKRNAGEIRYYPSPPPSPEPEVVSSPPSADHIWTLGHYDWQDQRFVWRRGGWYRGQPDWIWNPPHHLFTPAGVVYVDGFWDHPVETRAVLFAPVSIPPDVLEYPNFYYRPRVTIDPQVLLDHLFCQAAGCHYCFGNYYQAEPVTASVFPSPWFRFHGRHGYDPLYAYYSWRRGSRWQEQREQAYLYRSQHAEARPADTFLAQQARFEQRPSAESEGLWLGRSLQDRVADRRSPLPLEPAGSGGDPAREGMPIPIMLSTDRANQEARLAAERAAAGDGNRVLVWSLPRAQLAQPARPSRPLAPRPGSSPADLQPSRWGPVVVPEPQPRWIEPALPPGIRPPSRRPPSLRLPAPAASKPSVSPRPTAPGLVPGSQGRLPSVSPRRPGGAATPGTQLPVKPRSQPPSLRRLGSR